MSLAEESALSIFIERSLGDFECFINGNWMFPFCKLMVFGGVD